MAGSEQLDRAQDQHRCGGVGELERCDRADEPCELCTQDRADVEVDRLARGDLRQLRCPDRVDDRGDGEQAGDDRQQDGAAHTGDGDKRDAEQRGR